MLNDKDIDTLLRYLDRAILEEIRRICDVPVAPMAFDSLLTAEDVAIAKSMGIAF